MVKELVIHIGDCKTGSTAIQTCLAGGTYELPSGSLLYPTAFNHNPLAQGLGDLPGMEGQKAHLDSRFRELARTFAASDADWGVISAELFEFVEPERLKQALETYMPGLAGSARIIGYARPHHARLVSAYAERVKKTGGPATMAAFFNARLKTGQLTYFDRFARWREVFGDRFRLRPFLPGRLVRSDVVTDFLAQLCGDTAVVVTEAPRRNSSLSLRNLVMLRVAHAQLAEHPALKGPALVQVRRQLGWHMAPYLSAHEPAGSDRLVLPRGLAAKVTQACREDAAAMDEAFFRGTPMARKLRETERDAPEKAHSMMPEDHLSPGEIGMIRGWADTIAHIAASDLEHFSWAVRPEIERTAIAMPEVKRKFG